MPQRERHANIIRHTVSRIDRQAERREQTCPRERHTNIIRHTVSRIDRQAERREQTYHQERDIPT